MIHRRTKRPPPLQATGKSTSKRTRLAINTDLSGGTFRLVLPGTADDPIQELWM
jgi:hypothetical protein